MTDSLGTARLDVVVGTEQFDAAIQRAQTRISGLSASAQSDFSKMSAAQKRVSETALKSADTFGKSRQEVILYNAALKGVPTSILEELKTKLASAGAAAKETGANLKSFTLSDSQLFSANKALGEFKANLEGAGAAARKSSEDFQRAAFNPAQLYSANKALAEYKKRLNDAATAASSSATAQARIDAGLARENGVRERLSNLLATERGQRLASAQATNQHAAAIGRATVEFSKYGVSAKQQAAALRGVPAQVTDIFTSLASGQRPITVLLQQGGQLKDMFGGIVPAARALGGAIAGLINPFTVTAGASLALFLAWKQGSDEAVGFRQSLALTGDVAGVTADEMQAMAIAISQGVPTQHQAAAALAEVAKTGKFAGEQLQQVAETALAMEKATGQAVSTTVEQFAKFRGDPVKALLELNDQYHFLTVETLEHVKALQAQGREEEALSSAIKIASGALTDRAGEVVQNASYMERAWSSLKAVVLTTWDAIRDAGRASTAMTDAQMKIASANSQLKSLEHTITTFVSNGGVYSKERETQDRREIERLKKVKADAARVIADDPAAKAARVRAGAQRAQDAALSLDQEADSFESATRKLEKRRTAALGRMNEAVSLAQAAGNEQLVASIKDDGKKIVGALDKQISEAKQREQRKEVGGGTAARSGGARIAKPKSLPEINTEAAAQELDRLAAAEQRATESFRDMEAQLQGPMAVALRDHEKRVAELNALAEQSPEAANRLNAALELEAKRHDEVTKSIEAAQNPLKLLLDDMQFELDLIGKSNAERAVMIELRRQNIDLMSAEGQAAVSTAKDFETEAEAKQRAINLMDEFRGSASNALADVISGAKSAKDAVLDFFDSIIRAASQAIADKLVQQAFGSMGSSDGGPAGGGDGEGGWLSAFASLFANAKGNAFDNGHVMAFANGGVVNRATLFPMRNGMGLMGEAGPEAIMPLQRGPDGKLGVRMDAAPASRGDIVQHNTYHVMGSMDRRAREAVRTDNQRLLNRAARRNG